MKIYSSYDDEPETHYLPLPERLYSELYDHEMSRYTKDVTFYTKALNPRSNVIELGCGTGRLSRRVASSGHNVIGIDLSLPMLQAARKTVCQNIRYLCMDMRNFAIRKSVDAIVIPYNTLNLLIDNNDVHRCLRGCWEQLKRDGQLLMQLYIVPDEIFLQPGKTTFQFQLFDTPEGGKVVKEILRKYSKGDNHFEMIERYKIRPMTSGQSNTNYSHTLYLNTNTKAEWLNLISSAGFTVQSQTGHYENLSESHPSLLLIQATKRE